jgi:hypothetical protein
VSFSIDTNAASVIRLQNAPFAQIYGYISTSGTQMYETAVRKWLHHADIVNLELTAIRRCDSSGQFHEKIEKFLKESTTTQTQSRLTGDGNRQGLRLRVDLCMDSAAPPDRGGRRCSSTVARLATASAECDSARTAPMPTPPPARAATSPLASAAPLRVSFRTRIQIFASAPDAQMNRAATDGAMELLDSLDSRKTRLCLVRGRFACGDVSPAASETEELIYAVIAPTREDCFSYGEAPRCRAELFMHVQVHETGHPAFVPGACRFQDSQQGGLHRRTLAKSRAVGEAVFACRRNHCVDRLLSLAGGGRNVPAGETSPDKTQARFARIERIQQLHRPVCCRPVHLSVGAARENLDPCAK